MLARRYTKGSDWTLHSTELPTFVRDFYGKPTDYLQVHIIMHVMCKVKLYAKIPYCSIVVLVQFSVSSINTISCDGRRPSCFLCIYIVSYYDIKIYVNQKQGKEKSFYHKRLTYNL